MAHIAPMNAHAHPPSSIEAALAAFADELEVLGDWEERYRYLIDLGRELAPLTEAEHSEANKVKGCASIFAAIPTPTSCGD